MKGGRFRPGQAARHASALGARVVASEIEEALAANYDGRRDRSYALVHAGPHAVEAYWDDSDGRDILTVEVFGNRSGMPLPNVEDVIAAAVDTARVRRDVRNEAWLAEWRAEAEEDTRRGVCRSNGWEYIG